MGRLFGTDGIRGVAGEPPLDAKTVYHTGYCLAEYLAKTGQAPHVLIARDTRESGPWLEELLVRAIEDAGGSAEPCGILSTPSVSYLVSTSKEFDAGIMISASHNPYRDNGIKIFSSQGMKLSDAIEENLEARIFSSDGKFPQGLASPQFDGKTDFHTKTERSAPYLAHLRSSLPNGFDLEGLRLVVDCAHGALSSIAPAFLGSFGAEVQPLHHEPDGRNINRESGALHTERLQKRVVESGADLGIAFDGDADRVMFVDAGGRMHDGDHILYLFARYLDHGSAPKVVVGTVMANLGLEVVLGGIGWELVRTAVGDRYVLEEMLRCGAALGGEQSGHIILRRYANTGDGLLTAVKLLEVLRREGAGIDELSAPVPRYPQVLINVPVVEKLPFESVPGLQEEEARCRKLLGPRSRIVLRYSGTEKLARVMVEGEDEASVQEAARGLASVIELLKS